MTSCLKENNATFGIVRLYRNVGKVDTNSSKSILAASSVINNIDGYMFPCVSQAPYSIQHNITCDDASVLVTRTLQFLAEEGIWVNNSSVSPAPFFPVRATLGRIWIDIEDEVPSKYFSPDTNDNTKFLSDMVQSMKGYGIEVGIYTTKTYWSDIMDNVLGYGNLKLWYPRYDGVNNMDSVKATLPFADFTQVYIKQTGGDVELCGLSQVDSDYMDEA